MEINDVWYTLYDKGASQGISLFNSEQKHLFFYIDFTIYVANGGGEGFLYNHSPCTLIENNYQTYIESLYFFGYIGLSEKLLNYNTLYANAIALHQKKTIKNWNECLQQFDLQQFEQEIILEIEQVIKDEVKIYEWIGKNIDILMRE